MIDQCFKDVVRKLGINKVVETGTDMGETVAEVAKWFAEIEPKFGSIEKFFETGAQSYNKWNVPIQYPHFANCSESEYKIWSVDLDKASYDKATKNFSSNNNITLVNDSSEKFLRTFREQHAKQTNSRVLFFLDAHWGKFWPIRDELKTIASLDKFIIAIDDFFVPGKSNVASARGDFGFDFYHDRVLCWGYVHDCFAPNSVRVFYPPIPNRDRRGWCLIARGYRPEELEFLKALGLFEIPAEDSAHKRLLQPVFSTYLDLRIALRMVLPLSWLRKGFQVTRSLGLKVG